MIWSLGTYADRSALTWCGWVGSLLQMSWTLRSCFSPSYIAYSAFSLWCVCRSIWSRSQALRECSFHPAALSCDWTPFSSNRFWIPVEFFCFYQGQSTKTLTAAEFPGFECFICTYQALETLGSTYVVQTTKKDLLINTSVRKQITLQLFTIAENVVVCAAREFCIPMSEEKKVIWGPE